MPICINHSIYICFVKKKQFFFVASPIFNTCPQIQKLRFIWITFYFEKILYTVKLYSCFLKILLFIHNFYTHPFFLIPMVLLTLIGISFHLLRYITQFKWLIRIRESFDIANELMTFKLDSFVTRKKIINCILQQQKLISLVLSQNRWYYVTS